MLFDTLKYAKTLMAGGVPKGHAEAQAEALSIVVEGLATKQDLKALELITKQDLKALELATKRDIEKSNLALKHELIIKLGSLMGGFLALATTILGALISFYH